MEVTIFKYDRSLWIADGPCITFNNQKPCTRLPINDKPALIKAPLAVFSAISRTFVSFPIFSPAIFCEQNDFTLAVTVLDDVAPHIGVSQADGTYSAARVCDD
jgi:hypothetical protein